MPWRSYQEISRILLAAVWSAMIVGAASILVCFTHASWSTACAGENPIRQAECAAFKAVSPFADNAETTGDIAIKVTVTLLLTPSEVMDVDDIDPKHRPEESPRAIVRVDQVVKGDLPDKALTVSTNCMTPFRLGQSGILSGGIVPMLETEAGLSRLPRPFVPSRARKAGPPPHEATMPIATHPDPEPDEWELVYSDEPRYGAFKRRKCKPSELVSIFKRAFDISAPFRVRVIIEGVSNDLHRSGPWSALAHVIDR